MAPALAALRALDRAEMTLADMDLDDIHEAFAAQVAFCCRYSTGSARGSQGPASSVGTPGGIGLARAQESRFRTMVTCHKLANRVSSHGVV